MQLLKILILRKQKVFAAFTHIFLFLIYLQNIFIEHDTLLLNT